MYTLCARIVSHNCAEILDDGLIREEPWRAPEKGIEDIDPCYGRIFECPNHSAVPPLPGSGSGFTGVDYRHGFRPLWAPVPGANVVIIDVERGVNKPVVSNQSGRYESGPLVPGHYSITVEAKGFKKFVRTNILLVLSQQAGVDVPLELGAVTETVNVTTTAPLLETETANRGAIVTPDFVRDLPTTARHLQSGFRHAGRLSALHLRVPTGNDHRLRPRHLWNGRRRHGLKRQDRK